MALSVWYTTHLQPVPSLTASERISLNQDKIARIEIVFDQMPLAQAFGGKAPAHDPASRHADLSRDLPLPGAVPDARLAPHGVHPHAVGELDRAVPVGVSVGEVEAAGAFV